MKESALENLLKNSMDKIGVTALKLTVPGRAGMPDRMILIPGGEIIFVEMKAPGKKPRPLQIKRHKELEELGFDVRVIDSRDGVEALKREIQTARLSETRDR